MNTQNNNSYKMNIYSNKLEILLNIIICSVSNMAPVYFDYDI